jgi:Xaa-Pro dipeptidase
VIDRGELRAALDEVGADGWLIFDFHGLNPVASRVLGLRGLNTRRIFVLLPRDGEPVAVAHKIELQALEEFPGKVIPYARWSELHQALGPVIAGRTLAMEISPEDAVPYLDRVPLGVIDLLRRLGARVVPSGSLVSRFAARWSQTELADHRFAAEILAEVARQTLSWAVRQAGDSLTESGLQAKVMADVKARGLVFKDPPIVAFGANSAKPHYEPEPGSDATLQKGDLILLDLWAGRSQTTVFADQTWVGFAGDRPPERMTTVWQTVCRARDAAIDAIRQAASQRRPIAGYEADRAARAVIDDAGYGDAFVHRTGHSIDRDVHGSGPHLDDYETHDERLLIPGVGIRSEVNVFMGRDGPEVTPREPQMDLITVESRES